MNNDIVQLTDNSGNNVYPIAGGATQGSISKSMLAEGVFEGPELSPPSSLEYVRTENIVDGAVTSDKIDSTTLLNGDITLASGYYFTDSSSAVIAKKIAGVVYFYYGLRCPALTSTDNQTVAFTLPSGWRPIGTINFITQCGIGYLCRIRIDANGEIKVSKFSTDIPNQSYAQFPAINFTTY